MLTASSAFSISPFQIDCFGTGMATCRKYGVRSWPQVKLFKYGKYEGEYYGAEDACKTIESSTILFIHSFHLFINYNKQCKQRKNNSRTITKLINNS